MIRLFQPCDRHAVRSEKYVEHGTPIIKLVSAPIRKALRALAKEGDDDQ